MMPGFRLRLIGIAIALALAVGALTSGCGGSDKPAVTIGAPETAEETILAEIYAQALEGAGYTVKTLKLDGEEKTASKALEGGRISGYPDHLDNIFTGLLGRELPEAPTDPQRSYEEAKAELEKKGLTAFPPTPFSFTNAVGTLKTTAEERDLTKVSDLRGQSEELTITGVAGCHESVNCVEGLERLYGLPFAGFIYRTWEEPEPFEALRTEFTDLAMVPNTDGRLAAEKDTFVSLEEDEHLFPAGNAIFVTTPQLVKEAGPDLEEAIVEAQKDLTLTTMQELDAQVEIEELDPADVAAEYLDGTS